MQNVWFLAMEHGTQQNTSQKSLWLSHGVLLLFLGFQRPPLVFEQVVGQSPRFWKVAICNIPSFDFLKLQSETFQVSGGAKRKIPTSETCSAKQSVSNKSSDLCAFTCSTFTSRNTRVCVSFRNLHCQLFRSVVANCPTCREWSSQARFEFCTTDRKLWSASRIAGVAVTAPEVSISPFSMMSIPICVSDGVDLVVHRHRFHLDFRFLVHRWFRSFHQDISPRCLKKIYVESWDNFRNPRHFETIGIFLDKSTGNIRISALVVVGGSMLVLGGSTVVLTVWGSSPSSG